MDMDNAINEATSWDEVVDPVNECLRGIDWDDETAPDRALAEAGYRVEYVPDTDGGVYYLVATASEGM